MIEKPTHAFLVDRLREATEEEVRPETRAHLATLVARGPNARLDGFKTGRTTARAVYFLVTGDLPEDHGKDEVNAVITVAERMLNRHRERLARAIERGNRG